MSSLVKRIIVSFILVPLIMFILYLPSFFVFLFLILWLCFADYEFLKLCEIKNVIFYFVSFIGIVCVLFAYFFLHEYMEFVIFMYFIVGVISWIFVYAETPVKNFLPLFFSLFYLGWLPGHLLELKEISLFYENGYWILLFPFAVTWINDTGAYFTGLWLGRHKLVGKLSPKKTWEGFFGGVIWSLGFSIIYRFIFLRNIPCWFIFISSLILGVIAELGDVFESGFKREKGVKDSSKIFSEHGGVLDRTDSLIFTIPTFYYLFKYLLLY